MNTNGLLLTLRHLDVVLEPQDDGRLRVESPAGTLPDELKAAIRENRDAILAMLADEDREHRRLIRAKNEAFQQLSDLYRETGKPDPAELARLDDEYRWSLVHLRVFVQLFAYPHRRAYNAGDECLGEGSAAKALP